MAVTLEQELRSTKQALAYAHETIEELQAALEDQRLEIAAQLMAGTLGNTHITDALAKRHQTDVKSADRELVQCCLRQADALLAACGEKP